MTAVHIASTVLKFFYQRTPLHVAVSEGQESTVKFLVDRKADLIIKDYRGVSSRMKLLTDGRL